MFLSIIIPAYNEEKRIEQTLRAVNSHLTAAAFDYELIVVNDGSLDGTRPAVERLMKSIPNLKILENTMNEGKGASVRRGMLAAEGHYRLFMDADNSTSITHWDAFQRSFEEGYDVVISTRRGKGAVIVKEQGLSREVLGYMFRAIVKLLFRLEVSDTQNGFKAFTADATQKIFRALRTNRWAFDIEVLLLAKKYDLKVKEIPVTWSNDLDSRVTVAGMFHMLFELVWMRLNYL